MIMAQHDLITAQHATQAKLDALLAQQTHAKKAKQNVVVPNFIKNLLHTGYKEAVTVVSIISELDVY
eukprot:Seg4710.2 transcript_id=Seg4710.2/GoldUCD/mRNA.D3Y31 product="hypothetical protein" pseudo=true protein_id=Seg4710.2/GoldUCD/D3Y31